MDLVTVRELYRNREEYLDKEVTIGGWVRSIRDSKTFGFIVVNDGSFFENLQVVYHDNMENFGEISKLNVGAAIIVKGTLVATPQAKQPFEIQATEVVVEGTSAPDYPLQKKRHSFEYLRSIAHLRPRTNTFQAVFRVRSLTAYAIHKFFQERGFVYVHTPLITGSDCEGAGEMFQVTTLDMNNVPKNADGTVDYSKDFFGKETNLTVSGQLNGETYAQAFRNIYTFGPTFRAENSNTTRHAAEFWMIEPEIAFADLADRSGFFQLFGSVSELPDLTDRLFSGIPVCDYSRHTEFSGSSRRGTAWTRKSDPLYASTLSCLLCLYGSRSGKYFCDRIL